MPVRFNVKVTARADSRGVAGLYGVTQWMKGLITSRAVRRDEGIERGKDERNGFRSEGVDWWRDLVQWSATVSR